MRPKMIALGIAGVLAVAAVAVVATASANGGGGPLGFLGGDPEKDRAQYAKDLAGELGIDQDRVEKAMDDVEQKRRDAFETEQAKALADKLDVSEEDAKKALQEAQEKLRDEIGPPPSIKRLGEHPRRVKRLGEDPFVKALADARDKDVADVRTALRDIARDKLNAKLDEAVKNGNLTKEQADRIRDKIESADGKFGLRVHGRGPGPGGPGPGGPGPDFHFEVAPPPGG
jgi:hypothetical protein